MVLVPSAPKPIVLLSGCGANRVVGPGWQVPGAHRGWRQQGFKKKKCPSALRAVLGASCLQRFNPIRTPAHSGSSLKTCPCAACPQKLPGHCALVSCLKKEHALPRGAPGLRLPSGLLASAPGERVAERLAKEAVGWQLTKHSCGVCCFRGLEQGNPGCSGLGAGYPGCPASGPGLGDFLPQVEPEGCQCPCLICCLGGGSYRLSEPLLWPLGLLCLLCQYNLCSVQSATLHNKMSLPVLLCLCTWSWGRCVARALIFRAAGDSIPQRYHHQRTLAP